MSSLKLAALLAASSLAFAASARLVYAGCHQTIVPLPGGTTVTTTDCDSPGKIQVTFNGKVIVGVTISSRHHACPLEMVYKPDGSKCDPSTSEFAGCEHADFKEGRITIWSGCQYVNGKFNACGNVLQGYPGPSGDLVEVVKSQTCPPPKPDPTQPSTQPSSPEPENLGSQASQEAVTFREMSRFDQARLVG